MEQTDSEKMDRKTGSAPGFLRHVEAAELKDAEEKPAPEFQQGELLGRGGVGGESEARTETQEKASVTPGTPERVEPAERPPRASEIPEKASVIPEASERVPVIQEKASVMPGGGLGGGIVTRLTPPPLMSGDLLTDPGAMTARHKSRIARERAGPLLETRYIVLMLVLGIAVGAIIGTMVAMSLFP